MTANFTFCFTGQLSTVTLGRAVTQMEMFRGRYNFRNGGTHCDWPVDGICHQW